jgi:predicted DCC family thiol-disulfide oxidoreductase YuxK
VKHSWTGGQYSAWRALLGLALALALVRAIPDWPLRFAATLACLALAIGASDRLTALLLAVAWWAARDRFQGLPSPGSWSISALLVLHALTHGAPYGSFRARGRVDPAGGWILPRWNLALRRLIVLAAAGVAAARGACEVPGGLAAALLLSAADPGWIPPRRRAAATRVFYDGACGLCHRFVRFLLAEDFRGRSFRYAPLQGSTFESAFAPDVRAACPDSIVVEDDGGRALVRSAAVLLAMERLGGLWRAIAVLSRLVPSSIRDLAYDGVARVRRRIFAKPPDVCPLLPAHLARRFDP